MYSKILRVSISSTTTRIARISWGARELERQIAASLYERLALSRDKEGVRQLAQKGFVVEKPADVIKKPFCV
ncbi:MAG: hypothetical protein WCL42_07200 [Chlorobiaceae bacterium]